MNILFLTRRFYPEIGGVEKHVLKLSEELIKLGHNITIITEHSPKKFTRNYQITKKTARVRLKVKKPAKSVQSDTFTYKKIKVILLNPGKDDWFKKFRIWKWFIANRELIEPFDIVHCHDVFFWYLPLRFVYPFKKVFTTFHGYETAYPPRIGARLVRKVSELLSRGNICVGDYIKKWYGTRPDFITYGAVEEEGLPRTKLARSNYKNSILILGRLESDNGMETYMEVLEKLQVRGFKYKLKIAGNGVYKQRFSKLGGIITTNMPTNKLIERTTFVFASSYLSIFEAIYRGKIVFATFNNPLKKDYLKMSPFAKYIEILPSSDEIVSKIIDYISNPKRYREASEREMTWAGHYSWAKLAKIYLKLWQK